MIVDSMTHAEVYAELAKERDAVTRWWRHQLDDNEGHWIDDPLDVVNAKPDFSGLGIEPKHKQKRNYDKQRSTLTMNPVDDL